MNKATKWIGSHKLAAILTIIGVALWIYTGIDYFVLLAPIMFIAGTILRAFPRTVIWAAIATYGTLVLANGWFVVLLGCSLCVGVPSTRGVTPVGDFKKSRKKEA